MPAPKRPNTAAATAAVRRRGDETAAARLREHGWVVITPEQVADLPTKVHDHLMALGASARANQERIPARWSVDHPGIGVLAYGSEEEARIAAGTAGRLIPPGPGGDRC